LNSLPSSARRKAKVRAAACVAKESAGNSLRRSLGSPGADLEPSKAHDHARERALLLDHIEPEARRSVAGRHPEGRAAASLQERGRAHRSSARGGQREDPHQHSVALRGAAVAPGVKTQGGMVSHLRNDVEVSCLPKDLPEFIEVDMSSLGLNESIHLSQLKVPAGVELVSLAKEDAAVAAIYSPRAEEPEPTAAAAGAAPRRVRRRRQRRRRPAAMRRRRPNPRRRTRRRNPRRRTRRSNSEPRRCLEGRRSGGPCFFRF